MARFFPFLHPVAGGVKLIADGATTRVRLPRVAAFWWGIGTAVVLGIVWFIAMVAVATHTNRQPSAPLLISAMALVFCGAVAVYVWQRRIICSGVYDLVINKAARTLVLPLTFGRKTPITVDIASIQCIWVEKATYFTRTGGNSYAYSTYLFMPRSEPSLQRLADWNGKRKNNSFAQWLGKEIGVPVQLSGQSSQTIAPKSGTDIAK